MERIKKVGVSLSALVLIFLLLGMASTLNNFSMTRTGGQIIEPWMPSPGMFQQTNVPVAGQAGQLPKPVQPWLPTTAEPLVPQDVQFFINGIMIPKMSTGEIQLRDDKIRTYEGKFGPYPYNPSQNLIIKICSQNRYASDAPTCEQITSVAFIENYVVFGYANEHDEYIGYYPRRQYTAYYEVLAKNGQVLAKSNSGKVRLMYT